MCQHGDREACTCHRTRMNRRPEELTLPITLQLGVWLSVGDQPPIQVGTAEVEAKTVTTPDGISIEATPAISDVLRQAAEALTPTLTCANHQARQHRDGKEPWCNECHLTEDGHEPGGKKNVPSCGEGPYQLGEPASGHRDSNPT